MSSLNFKSEPIGPSSFGGGFRPPFGPKSSRFSVGGEESRSGMKKVLGKEPVSSASDIVTSKKATSSKTRDPSGEPSEELSLFSGSSRKLRVGRQTKLQDKVIPLMFHRLQEHERNRKEGSSNKPNLLSFGRELLDNLRNLEINNFHMQEVFAPESVKMAAALQARLGVLTV